MGRIIVVSGTPGTGKTSVAKELAKRLNGVHLELSRLVVEKRLYSEVDRSRDTLVIDEERVRREIVEAARSSRLLVLDSHYGEIAPPELVDAIVILRMNPRLLRRRLEERGWSRGKVEENVQAELLGVCTSNALRSLGPEAIIEVDVTGKTVDEVVEEILERLRSGSGRGPWIDWTLKLSTEELRELLEGL